MNAHDLLSPKEIALKTGWPIARIRNLITKKEIRHVRIGGNLFLPANAIDEYVAANMVEPRRECLKHPEVASKVGRNQLNPSHKLPLLQQPSNLRLVERKRRYYWMFQLEPSMTGSVVE